MHASLTSLLTTSPDLSSRSLSSLGVCALDLRSRGLSVLGLSALGRSWPLLAAVEAALGTTLTLSPLSAPSVPSPSPSPATSTNPFP